MILETLKFEWKMTIFEVTKLKYDIFESKNSFFHNVPYLGNLILG